MFVIGRILKPQGVKGELRVFPTTDDPLRYNKLDRVRTVFEDRRETLNQDIEGVKFAGQFVLVKFKGIDSIDAAEQLRGASIIIEDEQALPLEADEYYIRDLYDMRVATESGEYLGVIADVLETGANDVYVVRQENGGDILIPAVKQYVLAVDVESRTMKVRIVEGMR